MKTWFKFVSVSVAAAVMALAVPNISEAGHPRSQPRHHDRHDNTAAAIVAGVAVVGLIAALASQHDRSYPPPRAYCPPPPPPPRQQWIPGHYETRTERVQVPGYWDRIVEPAEWRWVGRGRHRQRVMIKPECVRRVWVPPRWECQTTQVWVPGRFEVVRAY